MLIDLAAFHIIMPWGEQWRLQTQSTQGTLAGVWRPHAQADFISHGSVELTTQRTWTVEQVNVERAAIQKYLAETLRSPQRFVGFVERQYGATNITRWPVSVQLQASDNAANGSAWMIAQHGGVGLNGTRAGRTMNLTSSSVLDNSGDMRHWVTQRWQLELTGLDPVPTFARQMTTSIFGGGRVVLTPATPESFAAQPGNCWPRWPARATSHAPPPPPPSAMSRPSSASIPIPRQAKSPAKSSATGRANGAP